MKHEWMYNYSINSKMRIQSIFWSRLIFSWPSVRRKIILDRTTNVKSPISTLSFPSISRLLTKRELIARLCFTIAESTVLRRNTLVLCPVVVYEFTLWVELITQIQKRRKLESSFDILMPSAALNVFSMHNECFYTLITSLMRVLQRVSLNVSANIKTLKSLELIIRVCKEE